MSDTRSQIISLAEELVLTKGFNWFSYADISKPLGIKNAAVHYHFPSKEDLGVAIIQSQMDSLRMLKSSLATRNASEEESMRALGKFYNSYVKEQKVCLIGSMGTDLLTLPERMQKQLKVQLEGVWQWLTDLLESGRQKGAFQFDGSAKTKAFQYLTTVSSGVQIARITGKGAEFETLVEQFFAEIK
jgi:TetR/AcrR family transcriptional regulator, transcriptional repressor for nem operon